MKERAVKIDNLNYSYPDGKKALTDLSFTIYKHDTIGLIGPNGAGKSTLIHHLNGILSGNGKIEIFSLEINKTNLKEIRKKVGIVFQNPDDQLFMSNVFDDIAFGPLNYGLSPEEVKIRVKNIMKIMRLEGYEKRFPYHLSTGEKKRAAIATVLAMEPEIIILDEPTSNLDPKGRRELIGLLKTIKNTKIIATHDMELVLELCTGVILLNKGKIVRDGNMMDILSDERLLTENDLEMPLTLKLK